MKISCHKITWNHVEKLGAHVACIDVIQREAQWPNGQSAGGPG